MVAGYPDRIEHIGEHLTIAGRRGVALLWAEREDASGFVLVCIGSRLD